MFYVTKVFSVQCAASWIAPRPLRPNPGDIPRGHRDISGSAGRGGAAGSPKTLNLKVSPKTNGIRSKFG